MQLFKEKLYWVQVVSSLSQVRGDHDPQRVFHRGQTSKAKWKNLVKQTAGHTDTQAKFSTFFVDFNTRVHTFS